VILSGLSNQKCRLGQVVLGRYCLHRHVVGKARQHHHRSRVPGKPLRGEGIKLKYGY
jgi:hypothetical protein